MTDIRKFVESKMLYGESVTHSEFLVSYKDEFNTLTDVEHAWNEWVQQVNNLRYPNTTYGLLQFFIDLKDEVIELTQWR